MCESLPVISLLDMDCFYVQVEARDNPSIAGVPAAVVQYKTWKGGGIIAVNYEARAKGVTRQMRGDEAREKCPDIVLVRVPEVRDKADLTKYRKAGREVIEVLLDTGAVVERASIDEAYLDLSMLVDRRLREGEVVKPEKMLNTHVGGDDGDRSQVVNDWCKEVVEEGGDDLRLAVGAQIMEEVRAEVFRRTEFRCSAGISHCKTLAKLCCGLNKPNKQTVLPQDKVASLYKDLPITKVRGLGGKLGHTVVSTLGVETMGQLAEISLSTLTSTLEQKTATWLHMLCKGRDMEQVKERELPKSIGCSKNFQGKEMLNTKEKVSLRLMNLVEELVERVEEDKEEYGRVARGLTVGVGLDGEGHVSRAGQLHSYSVPIIFKEAFSLLSRLNTSPSTSQEWTPPLTNLSISAGKFEDMAGGGNTKSITSFFSPASSSSPATTCRRPGPGQDAGRLAVASPATQEQGNENSPVSRTSIKSFFKHKTKALNENEITEDIFERKDDQRGASSATQEQRTNHVNQDSPVSSKSVKSFFKSKAQTYTEPILDKDHDLKLENEDRENVKKVISAQNDINKITAAEDSTHPDLPQPSGAVPKDNAADDNTEENICVDIAELIPSLASFSPSLLSLLPPKLRQAAKDRVRELQEREKPGSLSRYLSKGDGGIVGEMVQCSTCRRMVSPFSLPEHMDYHYAQALARETGGVGREGGKRKREEEKEGEKNKKRTSDISKFFSKK